MSSDHIETIHLGTNDELARAHFPQFVRSLPQYREKLLQGEQSWTRVSKYISTLYGALACASSMQDLEILQDELQQFNHRLPPHTRYQPTPAPSFEQAADDLVQQGTALTSAPLHQEKVFRLLSTIAFALSLVTQQAPLDALRHMLESITSQLEPLSLAEES